MKYLLGEWKWNTNGTRRQVWYPGPYGNGKFSSEGKFYTYESEEEAEEQAKIKLSSPEDHDGEAMRVDSN